MLLETLDIKKDDLIIYSQNIFDFKDNFKVLYKDDPALQSHPISFNEVCSCVNKFIPKSLIVYRLLTNIDSFSISGQKYGFLISINNLEELIYLDPIFALKEMERYISKSSNYNLRFRIQQVGLTTLTRKNNIANYAEVYSIDLTGVEALHQNDKVYVDALLSDRIFQVNENDNHYTDVQEPLKLKITEDHVFDSDQLSKLGLSDNDKSAGKMNESVNSRTFADFLRKKAIEAQKRKEAEVPQPFLDIFYSNESLENLMEGKNNTKVILKLES